MIADNELIVDAFCGGGGASEGIRRATGRSPDIAINHDEDAIVMHEANHPETLHLRESIWTVSPSKVTKGVPVGLMWASPDCTHFSRAKGAKPVSRRRRSLANVIVKWAKTVSPRIICVENVPEFITWGPLDKDSRPNKAKAGMYFRAWVRSLERLGYAVEHRELIAADYGAPTTRKRLFIVARRDGEPIRWPAKTHGKGAPLPWNPVADCIDWSIPCPSIFERKKPLAEATLRRIARGIVKYVLNDPKPFIVNMSHGGTFESIEKPATTIKTERGGCRAVVAPSVVNLTHGGRNEAITEPAKTITCANRGEKALLAPTLVNTRNGEAEGQAPRARSVLDPAPTVTSKGSQGALAVAHLLKHYGGVTGQDAREPAGTITAVDHHSITVAHLTQHLQGDRNRDMRAPAPTIVAGHSEVRPGGNGHKIGVVAAHGLKLYGTATGQDLTEPAHTITGQGLHAGLVTAFLQEYYGNGNPLKAENPIPTIVTKDRVAVVTVQINGETYVITDIGMRMLKPRELARAQGFQDEYHLTGTQSNQVAKIGNSVVPHCAEALVRAQLGLGPIHQDDQQDLLRRAA